MKKNKISIYGLTLFLLCCISVSAKSQTSVTPESKEAYRQRMEWFDEAKLGIFIHWGIYSVDGVSESWSFYNNRIPYDQYMEQRKRFKAENYDPKQWVELIKESGAKYTVLTTKHHVVIQIKVKI